MSGLQEVSNCGYYGLETPFYNQLIANGWHIKAKPARTGVKIYAAKHGGGIAPEKELFIYASRDEISDPNKPLGEIAAEIVINRTHAQQVCGIVGHEWERLGRVDWCPYCRQTRVAEGASS